MQEIDEVETHHNYNSKGINQQTEIHNRICPWRRKDNKRKADLDVPLVTPANSCSINNTDADIKAMLAHKPRDHNLVKLDRQQIAVQNVQQESELFFLVSPNLRHGCCNTPMNEDSARSESYFHRKASQFFSLCDKAFCSLHLYFSSNSRKKRKVDRSNMFSGSIYFVFILCAFILATYPYGVKATTSTVNPFSLHPTTAANNILSSTLDSDQKTSNGSPLITDLDPNYTRPYLVTYTTPTPSNDDLFLYPRATSNVADFFYNGKQLSSSTLPPYTSPANKTDILLGYITTLTFPANVELADGRKISGAMTHAVDVVNNDPKILPEYRLHYVLGDNRGTELHSLDVLTDQWKMGARAFFGPEDSCEVESRVAAAWKIPILAYKCDSPVVSDKTRFPTLARTQPPATHSVTSVIALMKSYNWSKFTIVVEKVDLMPRAGLSLQALAWANNMTVNDFVNITGPYSPLIHAKELHTAIQDTQARTRIYVVYSKTTMFLDMVRYMQFLGLSETEQYVVITVRDDEPYTESMSESLMFYPSEFDKDKQNASVSAFEEVLLLVGRQITNPLYKEWEDTVRDLLYMPPVNLPKSQLDFLGIKVTIPVFAAYLYDSVLLYARALHEVLTDGGSADDGEMVFGKMKDRTFLSVQGHDVYVDNNGDAEGNFTVLALRPVENQFGRGLLPVGRFTRNPLDRQDVTYVVDVDIYDGDVPLDEPVCGYDGQQCRKEPSMLVYIVGGCIGGIGLIFVIILAVFYRNWRYEQELASLIWKIDIREIHLQPDAAISALSMISNNGPQSTNVSLSLGPDQEQRFTKMGVYRGTLVALKQIKKKSIDTSSREIKLELKQMRDLRHDNIVQFIGATIDVSGTHIVTEYCSKGSLEDILENSDLKLDDMFIASIISDILKGMNYIHSTALISHGNLKSSNCLVDSRWVVKISDFGLNKFKAKQEMPYHGEHANYKRFLWTAPELLRMDKPPLGGTQKGDVYSFSILLYEILNRNGPYGDCHLTPKEIVERVKEGPHEGIPFRPSTSELSCEGYIQETLMKCWHEDPDLRPDFKICRKDLRAMQKGMRSNIFDNMMMLMEKYANNLESVVAERTVELHEEKKKTETLLYRMLPTSVAAQLVRGQSVIPEAFDSVTIYFSDICGFTAMSSESTPLQIVDMLNDLYTLFDGIIKDYDVYKVETIGDAYMVVSGLPKRNGNTHAGEIASMSLSLLSAIKQFKIRHRPDDMLKLRIGIHTGSCVAGVVGQTMPRYCLFGDTVNTASRMESNGEALRIHVSPKCKAVLDELGGYSLKERGVVSMKGKGEMRTYWLEDEDITVREKRARNSDDSGVNTDGPTELSHHTNVILIHKQRALQHQQQQQLQEQFVRQASGGLRSSLGLGFTQHNNRHRRSTGDNRSMTAFVGGRSTDKTDNTATSPSGKSSESVVSGGGSFPRRSRSARVHRYHTSDDIEALPACAARSISQTFGANLVANRINPGFIVDDETIEKSSQQTIPDCDAVVATNSTSAVSPTLSNATTSDAIVLQVPDLLPRVPVSGISDNINTNNTQDSISNQPNPSSPPPPYTDSSNFIYSKCTSEKANHTNQSPGTTTGLLGGSSLGGHEYSGHPDVKTGLWVDKHAEFHRHNTEPSVPKAKLKYGLFSTSTRNKKQSGKKKHKSNHKPDDLNSSNEMKSDRICSTHSPAVKRREGNTSDKGNSSSLDNTESLPKTPVTQTIQNVYLNTNTSVPSKSTKSDHSEDVTISNDDSNMKSKDRPFNLHIFNPKKIKHTKHLNISGVSYDFEIADCGIAGSFSPKRLSPDATSPSAPNNKVHPLLVPRLSDSSPIYQMEDCPSPSRFSVTFSEDTVL